jgi:hypothetical protein
MVDEESTGGELMSIYRKTKLIFDEWTQARNANAKAEVNQVLS